MGKVNLKREEKRKEMVRKRALRLSDKQLLNSANNAYRRRNDKLTELPPVRARPFKRTLPNGEKCLAWISYSRGYKVRQCGKKTDGAGYCVEHKPEGRET